MAKPGVDQGIPEGDASGARTMAIVGGGGPKGDNPATIFEVEESPRVNSRLIVEHGGKRQQDGEPQTDKRK